MCLGHSAFRPEVKSNGLPQSRRLIYGGNVDLLYVREIQFKRFLTFPSSNAEVGIWVAIFPKCCGRQYFRLPEHKLPGKCLKAKKAFNVCTISIIGIHAIYCANHKLEHVTLLFTTILACSFLLSIELNFCYTVVVLLDYFSDEYLVFSREKWCVQIVLRASYFSNNTISLL